MRGPRNRLALSLTILFVGYSTLLLWDNYEAQVQIRDSALQELSALAGKHSSELAEFLAERADDVLDQANSRPVHGYFMNRNLGMSMEYGLRANLSAIEASFRQFIMRKTHQQAPLYDGMMLLDLDSTPLAMVGKSPSRVGAEGDFMTYELPDARLLVDKTHAQIVISTLVSIDNQITGRLVAAMSAKSLARFVDLFSDTGPIRESLVDRAGVPLLASASQSNQLRGKAGVIAEMADGEHRLLSLNPTSNEKTLLFKNVIGETGYALVTTAPESYLSERATPGLYLLIAALVPLVVMIASFYLLHLQRINRELAHRFLESDRQRGELINRASNLEQEIMRREAAEAELSAAMAEAAHLAHYDSLTGLSNRAMFRDTLRLAIQSTRREGRKLAVMFIDLDRFKRINDTLGHPAGDGLLREVARRVMHCIRQTDIVARESSEREGWCVARQGGDEFTLLLAGLDDGVQAAHVAQRLIESILLPVNLDGHEVVVTCSVGISMYPEDGEDEDTLLKNADTAMYTAKENGRNQYHFFEAAMQEAAMRRLELENDLSQACDKSQMYVCYQPLVRLADQSVPAYEALLRWKHPEKGMIPPSEFIPLAEESGQIIPITNLVLNQVAKQARIWTEQHGYTPRIAVNLSGRILDLVDVELMVNSTLRMGPPDVPWLEIELTESTLMHRQKSVTEVFQRLRAMGVRISIDDFGTGYSSLAYLKTFAVDTLKIDRSFIIDLPQDKDSTAIVRAIIAMAHSLNLEVVAEGVETQTQLEYLRGTGCDIIQGYIYGRPLPESQIHPPSRSKSVA